jgi:hypothetical protein
LVPGEAAAMRRVQTPSRGGVQLPINHLEQENYSESRFIPEA